jgi:hypothetical protein
MFHSSYVIHPYSCPNLFSHKGLNLVSLVLSSHLLSHVFNHVCIETGVMVIELLKKTYTNMWGLLNRVVIRDQKKSLYGQSDSLNGSIELF